MTRVDCVLLITSHFRISRPLLTICCHFSPFHCFPLILAVLPYLSWRLITPQIYLDRLPLLNILLNARFPSPPMETEGPPSTEPDVSQPEMLSVEDAWKAHRAVRDEDLTNKLCNALSQILGQTSSGSLAKYSSPCLDAHSNIWKQPNGSQDRVRRRFLFCSCLTSNFSLLPCLA